MCQLCLIATKYEAINRILLLHLSRENSRISHQDGFGFFNGETIWKTEKAASAYSGLGKIISTFPMNKPIISHVRASSVVNREKGITVENAHPFESEDFILAHNGTLAYIGTEPVDRTKIDSAIFLEVLQRCYEDNVVDALNDAYAQFSGKFAFLLYAKKEKKYYIVKGSSAALFFSKLEIKDISSGEVTPGIVINTEKPCLMSGLIQAREVIELLYPIEIKYNQIQELENNTIYSFNEEVFECTKVGVVEETAYLAETENTEVFYIEKIKEFSRKFTIHYDILDEMFSQYANNYQILTDNGDTLMTASEEDIRCFFLDVISRLQTEFNSKSKRERKEYVRIWKRILEKESKLTPMQLYVKYKLQVPFFLNPLSTLEEIIK